jgi:low affinity Fe/Cu permease
VLIWIESADVAAAGPRCRSSPRALRSLSEVDVHAAAMAGVLSLPARARPQEERMMTGRRAHGLSRRLEALAHTITRFTGSTMGFALALGTLVVWGVTGPLFHFSDTWQLVINTGTTIVTFLMVFLIQRSQNKDSLALQLKLNEIVAALDGASNRLVNIEDLTEAELDVLHHHYARLATMAKRDVDLMQSHSVDEAATRHEMKHGRKNSGRKS